MNRNFQKEEEFYANNKFCFSYSSLNKLLFSPFLFYKDYILKDKEVRTDKHLVEGKLLHCLLFEPDNLKDKFSITPGKAPSDSVRKVLKNMSLYTDAEKLFDVPSEIVLDSLKEMNLYQSLKTDEQRIVKIIKKEFEPYWEFLSNSNVDVIDEDTLLRCKDQSEIIKSNSDVMAIFEEAPTDFELDDYETHAEKYLSCKLKGLPFGLHGYIDFFSIDHKEKKAVITDLKTTGKTISDFKETVDFYNYWLQAAIYCKLVWDYMESVENRDDYTIDFKFVVIDKYNQTYVFDVSQQTLGGWAEGLGGVLKAAEYHYNERNYSLPYEFLVNKVKL
tara:strand:- start:111 stop:1106 length:996 start_codon:yes stop_codon:yes gene_type:complete